MAEEIAFENGRISNFEGLVTLTLDRSYCIPSCITHWPLPTCQISLKSKKLLMDGWTDIRTYVRTDIWDRLYGRLWRVNLTSVFRLERRCYSVIYIITQHYIHTAWQRAYNKLWILIIAILLLLLFWQTGTTKYLLLKVRANRRNMLITVFTEMFDDIRNRGLQGVYTNITRQWCWLKTNLHVT